MEQLIEYRLGTVSFPQYEEYVNLAKEVALVLETMPLTEDNVKEVKRSLADARKIVDALNARRIEVKKALLEPYNALEAQVKYIAGIIDEADSKLRAQVRALEEQERENRKESLREIWNRRAAMYRFPAIIPNAFDKWLMPWHLNKTTPLSKAEPDMVAWMERVEKDLQAIDTMDRDTALLVMEDYIDHTDLSAAIAAAKGRKQRMEAIKQAAPKPITTATFIVTGEKDIQLAELLLKSNNINFERT